jgi:hypothetical protein
VERESARKIATAAREADAALHAAVEQLRTNVSDQAADTCHFELTRLAVDVGFHLLSPLYEEFPDLVPVRAERPGAGDPLRFRIPAAQLAPVREALARLRRVTDDVFTLVEQGASTPGEKLGYMTALSTIRDDIEEVTTRLARLSGPE